MAKRRTPEEWANLISQDIISCTACGGSIEGEYWFDGIRTDVRDLVWSSEVPQHLQAEVRKLLTCSMCHSSIDEWDDIGRKPAEQIEQEIMLEKADRRWGRKLADFAAFLEAYPMLGAAHAVGSRILREISAFPRVTLAERVWFRARRIKSGRKYTAEDMRVPDSSTAVIPVGRFNHPGQAHWYLAQDPDTAFAEVLGSDDKVAWLLGWKVLELPDVLDLATFVADESFLSDDPMGVKDRANVGQSILAVAMIAGDHLRRNVDDEAGWKPQYFVPQFVMDAAKRAGFRGIRYRSTRNGALNLVIFDRHEHVIAEGDPQIVPVETPVDDNILPF